MRGVCIPALLFAICPYTAQSPATAGQPRAALLRGNLLWIAHVPRPPETAVTVCLETDPNPLIVGTAERLASVMFADIRVRLRWYEPPACPAGAEDPVLMTLEIPTPAAEHPGALGVARPLEGSRAWAFYDRVQRITAVRWGPDDQYVAGLLAHVMAHEIAHLLQGTIRHSDSGILKAYWSDSDYARMTRFPLMFMSEDAILIHHGLEERRARLVSSESRSLRMKLRAMRRSSSYMRGARRSRVERLPPAHARRSRVVSEAAVSIVAKNYTVRSRFSQRFAPVRARRT